MIASQQISFKTFRNLRRAVAKSARVTLLGAACFGLAGCSTLAQSKMFTKDFWSGSAAAEEGRDTKFGLAELVRGNSWAAVKYFDLALQADPLDPHALLGLGIAHQNLGQFDQARRRFEEVLAVRPSTDVQMLVWHGARTMQVTQIAGAMLSALEAGGNGASLQMAASPSDGATRAGVGVAPPAYKPMSVQTSLVPMRQPQAEASSNIVGLTMADRNVVGRFTALRLLRDEGLITLEEYRARRNVNIGALLPLTSPPPANGLEQPVPTGRQISGRLQAIARALEARAMTAPQHAAERAMILDALMPEAPIAVAFAARMPKGLMQAADAVRRLEAVRATKLITSDEYSRERKAIGSGLQPKPKKASVQKGAVAKPSAVNGLGVHLASYRSKASAERGWLQIRRAHRRLLGSMGPNISRIDLGPGKGVYYRLKAGPVSNQGQARTLCAKLKRGGQYCTPSLIR